MSVVVPPESLELKHLGDFHHLNFLIFHSASSHLPALPLFPSLPLPSPSPLLPPLLPPLPAIQDVEFPDHDGNFPAR